MDLLLSFFSSEESGVTFLPEELSGSEERLYRTKSVLGLEIKLHKEWERTGVLELPSNDRVPLVQSERKISMTLDPLGVV